MVRIEILQPLAGYSLKVRYNAGVSPAGFGGPLCGHDFAAMDLFHAAGDFLAQPIFAVKLWKTPAVF
ncbi:MAG: hypothetical protein ABIP71_07825 [Verrucomicrobiota bacterium]